MFTSLAGQVRHRHRRQQGHRQGHRGSPSPRRMQGSGGLASSGRGRGGGEGIRRRALPALPPTSPSSRAWRRWPRPPPTGNGGIDILCANAGVFPPHKLEEMTSDQWDLVVDTNLKGTFHSVKACIPYLKKSPQGRIILTSSITGPVTGFPGWTHYGATKGRPARLHAHRLPRTRQIRDHGQRRIARQHHDRGSAGHGRGVSSRPCRPRSRLKRLGALEDIGNTALFLATKEAGYITGQTIIVDGGQIIPELLEALAQA